jgi:alkylation response protein AidB-like acyl-CoA dehydrogenase
MDLSYGAEAEAYRHSIQDFLAQNWRPDGRRGSELKDYIRAFRRRATEGGYLYRAIPKRYGGSEQPADIIRGQVIREEFDRKQAPMGIAGNGMKGTLYPADAGRRLHLGPGLFGAGIGI